MLFNFSRATYLLSLSSVDDIVTIRRVYRNNRKVLRVSWRGTGVFQAVAGAKQHSMIVKQAEVLRDNSSNLSVTIICLKI
jgi:hypothetical protein